MTSSDDCYITWILKIVLALSTADSYIKTYVVSLISCGPQLFVVLKSMVHSMKVILKPHPSILFKLFALVLIKLWGGGATIGPFWDTTLHQRGSHLRASTRCYNISARQGYHSANKRFVNFNKLMCFRHYINSCCLNAFCENYLVAHIPTFEQIPADSVLDLEIVASAYDNLEHVHCPALGSNPWSP